MDIKGGMKASSSWENAPFTHKVLNANKDSGRLPDGQLEPDSCHTAICPLQHESEAWGGWGVGRPLHAQPCAKVSFNLILCMHPPRF